MTRNPEPPAPFGELYVTITKVRFGYKVQRNGGWRVSQPLHAWTLAGAQRLAHKLLHPKPAPQSQTWEIRPDSSG